MSWEKDLTRVVEAVHKLSSLKHRLNLPAIARLLRRTQGFSSDKTIDLMNELMSQKRIKEVVYKGTVSFRIVSNSRRSTKPACKKTDRIDSAFIVSTMLKLLVEDNEDEAVGGVPEARLQAALIEQLAGAVTLSEIRRQITIEEERGTIEKNKRGDYVLAQRRDSRTPTIDLDMDLLSDGSLDEQHLSQNDAESKDDSLTSSQEVDLSQESQNTSLAEDTNPSFPVEDNKSKRIIRKKTIYDPSEFELTPITRKRKRGASTSAAVGRDKGNKQKRGGSVSNGKQQTPVDKDAAADRTNANCSTDPVVSGATDPASRSVSPITVESLLNGSSGKRAKTTASIISKQCCICYSNADKYQPSVLSCYLCLNIAHRLCVKPSSFYQGSSKWRCEDCKNYNPVVCSACELEDNQKQEVMLMCDYCDEFFHTDCHYPPVTLPLSTLPWRCSSCLPHDKNEPVKIKSEEFESDTSLSSTVPDKSSSVSTPVQPPQKEEVRSRGLIVKSDAELKEQNRLSFPLVVKACSRSCRHRPDEPIPSVDDWTVDQVSQYFYDRFGQDVAHAFQTQEIDGKALKGMSRHRVTNDLGLQLGIALKVLYYVKKIQLGTNLLHKLWT